MKLITKKELIETPGPLAFIPYSLGGFNDSAAIKVKKGVESDEKGNVTHLFLYNLFGFVDENSPTGHEWIEQTAKKKQLESGESILNVPELLIVDVLTIEDDEIFMLFELKDMENLIIPLAECFDRLTKEAFKPL